MDDMEPDREDIADFIAAEAGRRGLSRGTEVIRELKRRAAGYGRPYKPLHALWFEVRLEDDPVVPNLENEVGYASEPPDEPSAYYTMADFDPSVWSPHSWPKSPQFRKPGHVKYQLSFVPDELEDCDSD